MLHMHIMYNSKLTLTMISVLDIRVFSPVLSEWSIHFVDICKQNFVYIMLTLTLTKNTRNPYPWSDLFISASYIIWTPNMFTNFLCFVIYLYVVTYLDPLLFCLYKISTLIGERKGHRINAYFDSFFFKMMS